MPETKPVPSPTLPDGLPPAKAKIRVLYSRLVDAAARGEEGAEHWLDELIGLFPELIR